MLDEKYFKFKFQIKVLTMLIAPRCLCLSEETLKAVGRNSCVSCWILSQGVYANMTTQLINIDNDVTNIMV